MGQDVQHFGIMRKLPAQQAQEFLERPLFSFEFGFLKPLLQSLGERTLLIMMDEFQALDEAIECGLLEATNFKVKVVLDEEVPNVRPGFTCTADITTATRKSVVSVPIPAVAVRELVYDANGQVIKEPKTDKRRRTPEPVASAAELKPGQTRKETEGVFVVRATKAEFVPALEYWQSYAELLKRSGGTGLEQAIKQYNLLLERYERARD